MIQASTAASPLQGGLEEGAGDPDQGGAEGEGFRGFQPVADATGGDDRKLRDARPDNRHRRRDAPVAQQLAQALPARLAVRFGPHAFDRREAGATDAANVERPHAEIAEP